MNNTSQIKRTFTAKNNQHHGIVGLMPLYDNEGNVMTTMSYIAYMKNTGKKRPITFSWGGGPGSSSLMPNFAAAGPDIYNFSTQTIEENKNSWLEFTDIVFIDMPGTGWGRLTQEKYKKEIFCSTGDAYCFYKFIETFLRENNRLSSPVYLSGESYGGFRAALVANNLLRESIPIAGLVLLAPLLNEDYRTPAEHGNDMPYILALPTYIQAALHHRKLSKELLDNPEKTIEQGTAWAMNKYPLLLMKGDSLTPEERTELTNKLHMYTGLNREFIQRKHFRISLEEFNSNLLSDKVINYLDTRIADDVLTDDYGYFIFTMSDLMNLQLSVTPNAIDHIAQNFGYCGDTNYITYLPPDDWHFDPKDRQVLSILRDCLVIDKNLKLFVGLGIHDADLPYMANISAINHLLLPEEAKSRVHVKCYDGGHMFNTEANLLEGLTADIKSIMY